jgi:hypothetical protein
MAGLILKIAQNQLQIPPPPTNPTVVTSVPNQAINYIHQAPIPQQPMPTQTPTGVMSKLKNVYNKAYVAVTPHLQEAGHAMLTAAQSPVGIIPGQVAPLVAGGMNLAGNVGKSLPGALGKGMGMLTMLSKAAEYKKDKDDRRKISYTLGGALAGMGAGYAANKAFVHYDKSAESDSPSDLKKIRDNLGRQVWAGSNVSAHEMPNGKYIVVADSQRRAHANINAQSMLKGMPDDLKKILKDKDKIDVVATTGKNATALMHELGHTAGNRSTFANLLRETKRIMPPHKRLVIGSLAPGVASGITNRKAGETDEEYNKRFNRNVLSAGLGGSAVAGGADLLEEARANINASRLAKKMGVPLNKKELALGYGTYGSFAAIPTLAAAGILGAKYISDKKEKKLTKTSSVAITNLLNNGRLFGEKVAQITGPLQGPQTFDTTPQPQPKQAPKDWATAPVAGALIGGSVAATGSNIVNKASNTIIKGTKPLGTKTMLAGAGLGALGGAALTAMSDNPAH